MRMTMKTFKVYLRYIINKNMQSASNFCRRCFLERSLIHILECNVSMRLTCLLTAVWQRQRWDTDYQGAANASSMPGAQTRHQSGLIFIKIHTFTKILHQAKAMASQVSVDLSGFSVSYNEYFRYFYAKTQNWISIWGKIQTHLNQEESRAWRGKSARGV